MSSKILQRTTIEKLHQFTLMVTTKEYELSLVDFGRVCQGFEHQPTMGPPVHVVAE